VFAEYLTLLEGASTRLADHLRESYARTVAAVESVIGGELMLGEQRLKESIALRNPYIDPIHRLQVELLRRSRSHEGGLDEYERPLLLTLQGIAAGVRNTG